MSRCKSCGKEIRWVTMEKSEKTMPLDAKPVKAIVVSKDGRRGRMVDTFVSHFATCPHANQHRLPGVE